MTQLGLSEMRPEVSAEIDIRPAGDVLQTLSSVSEKVSATILDPWYNKGVGGYRKDYDEWLSEVILLGK